MEKKPFAGTFERIDEYRWKLPVEFMPGMRVPGVIVASRQQLEELRMDQTPQQVANVATLPGIVEHSLAMPDIHWGYGFPVGGVAAMDVRNGVVSPGGIGFDINCGVRLIRSSLKAEEVKPKLIPLMDTLFALVPAGVGSQGKIKLSPPEQRAVATQGARWTVEHGYGWPEDLDVMEEAGALANADFDEVSDRARERGKRQLGTLGSGNHFLEVQAVEEIFDEPAAAALGLFQGQAVVMIHSGSRGFGYQICDDFLEVCGKASGKHQIALPDRQLACAPISSEEGQRYLRAMAAGANFAWANRQAITHWVREAFELVFQTSSRTLGLTLLYDHCHNIAKIEEHTVNGVMKQLCVHRKGATRAFPPGHPQVPETYRAIGQPVLIPGDMGRGSYVLVGAPGAMETTWGTTCHGAGRRMSRTAARKLAKGRTIDRELYKEKGIVVRARERSTIAEEMPEAYKDVSEVVDVVHNAGCPERSHDCVPWVWSRGSLLAGCGKSTAGRPRDREVPPTRPAVLFPHPASKFIDCALEHALVRLSLRAAPCNILAIDQGTTGTTGLLFDERGRIMARGYCPIRQFYPRPGWVEHDSEDIWRSCLKVIQQTLAGRRIKLAAIGITNQRETTIVWNRKTGKPIHRAIVWQDRRTAPECAALQRRGVLPEIKRRTGLVLDPYFSGTKLAWLLRHIPGASRAAHSGHLAFGTVDTWIIWKLTGGRTHVTDPTNASRTMLYNLRSQMWDSSLLKLFRVPRALLPEVRPSAGEFGRTVRQGTLPAGIPIAGVAGDQQAALFGQGAVNPGEMKVTYGTGAFLLLQTGSRLIQSRHGLLTTAASNSQGKAAYALEGSVFIAGAVIQWLRDELKLITSSAESERWARKVPDTQGVYLVPAFTGLGAPWWDPAARGTITGLTRGANRAHLIRAALESIAYQTADVVTAMGKDVGRRIRKLRVDGGACQNDFLMQFQADILNAILIRPRLIETTAAGAAYLAGLGIGLWTPAQLKRLRATHRIFRPRMPAGRRQELLAGWHHAISQSRLQRT